MSLFQSQSFYKGERRVEHGFSYEWENEILVDVSESASARVIAYVKGKNGTTAGTFTVHFIGRLGTLEVEFDTLVITPSGVTKVFNQKLLDIRGFEEIKTYLSFTNVATQYVDARVYVGIPHEHQPR